MTTPSQESIELQALAAGLDRAWAEFREDILVAAFQVAAQRSALDEVPPADEPWPPMRVERSR